MDKYVIPRLRLINQQIARPLFQTPAEITAWLGAVQGQDYAGAKFSLALRLPGTTDADIEKAFERKEIIRSWVLRGTLHIVAPQDIYWLTDLVAEKIKQAIAGRLRRLDLDAKTLNKANKLMSNALGGGHLLTRNELATLLNGNKIPTNDMRLSHILQFAVLDKLICQGPRKDKEYTFASLPDYAPPTRPMKREDAILKLTKQFYLSHGPATIADYQWWSGLNLAEIKTALKALDKELLALKTDGQEYYTNPNMPENTNEKAIYLLPGFDEYMLGYKDRTHALDTMHIPKVYTNNGIFGNTIIINGKVEGTWKRTVGRHRVDISIHPFIKYTKTQQAGIEKTANGYAAFLGVKEAGVSYN